MADIFTVNGFGEHIFMNPMRGLTPEESTAVSLIELQKTAKSINDTLYHIQQALENVERD